MGKNIERLVIQQKYEDSLVAILDHGINLLLVTQFGECEKFSLSENVRDIVVKNVHETAEKD